LFGIVVQYNFKSIFYLKIYQNNFFKLFFTPIHQNHKKNINQDKYIFLKINYCQTVPNGEIYLSVVFFEFHSKIII